MIKGDDGDVLFSTAIADTRDTHATTSLLPPLPAEAR
jgi:hypothetical protein